MNSLSRHLIAFIALLSLALIVLPDRELFAQEGRKFASKGSTELGGSITFQSLTPVADGKTGGSFTTFTLAPFVGYFVADGFEVGLNPLGITTTSYSGSTTTQVMIFAAPSYNFKTEGIGYPFIEGLIGYTSESNGSTRSGISWGGRAGVKLAVTGKGLLILGFQYLQVNLNPSGASNRYGINELTVSAGFSVWF